MDVVEVERRRNGAGGCRASVAKGARILLDLVAFIYALYGSALFFIVILMWVFSILITIYVSISSGELWVQLFAVGLGIPFIGPFVNVLEEAFIVILRTLRVGFQSQLRPHVFEFLLLPYTFPDKAVFGRHPEKNITGGRSEGQEQDLAEPLNDEVSSPENSYNNRRIGNTGRSRATFGHARLERLYDAVHVAFDYFPPESFSMQQKLAFLFLAADFLCFIIFMLLEVSSGFAARAFVCLFAMLLCSVLRFLRSSPTSVAELHRRLSNGRSARWVKYTTGGAGIFIFSSTASSGLWAKRSDVYTFSISFFAVVIGVLSTLSMIAVCICPYPLPLQKHFPGLTASAEEARKENERRQRLESGDETASSSAVVSHPAATPPAATSTLIPTVAATVKSLFLTVVLFLLIVIFFIAIFISRGTGAGNVDEAEVSPGHRWWSLFVWLLLGAVAGAHSISDDELIGADDDEQEESSDKNNATNDNSNTDLIEGYSPKQQHALPSAPLSATSTKKKDDEKKNISSIRRSESELGTVAPTSESDEDGGQQQHYAPPVVPSRDNESESQSSTSNRAHGSTSATVAIAGKGEKISSSPTASADKKKAKKQKAFVRNTQVASRAIVGLTTFLFFVVVGCMTALNFPNTVPATFRAYDLSILSERKHPYTLCSAKWGTDDRFNVTDLVLIAKAAYYEDAGQVQQALRLWFNTPLNVSETTVVNDPHPRGTTVGEYGHSQSLGVRAYRIVFHETNRSVASALPAAVEPQSWMYAANVTLPRMDVVAVRGSHNGLDWLQDAYVWGDSIFFSLFNRVSPFSLPQSVVNSLVKWSKSLRYGVFGDISYFKQLKAIAEAVMDDARAENSSQVMIVGHSLGGGLAQLVGSALKIDAFAVSGVGIGYQAAAAEFNVDTARWYQSNIVPAHDPVPQIDLQIGEVQNIACSAAPNPLGCHSLSTTWGELARSCGDIRETNDLEGKSTPLLGELLSQIGIAIVFLFAWIKLINVRVVISAVMFLERRACTALSEADLKN